MNTFFQVTGLSAQAGTFKLQDISFSLERREYLIVLGPTGCGKTMLLETLAGLRKPTSGQIWIDGQDITTYRPEARSFGFAYQDSLIYPFLNVKDNILLGARAKKRHKDRIILQRLNHLAEVMGIKHLLDRFPRSLSGGEKQRISLARAILTCPPILFLDEPLSSLDPRTRCSMQELLREMHQTENLGMIHVTHDFNEALQLGTKVLVMNQGQICQQGKPLQLFDQPNSLFVANFLMQKNIKKGFLERKSNGYWFRSSSWGIGPLPPHLLSDKLKGDLSKEVYLSFSAGKLKVTLDDQDFSEKLNTWEATVHKVILHSTHVEIVCQGRGRWHAVLSIPESQRLAICEGSVVNLSVSVEDVHLITDP